MPTKEFNLIRDYFLKQKIVREDVLMGIGDDAAILQVPAGQALAVSMDTLVDGVHFDQHSSPYSIGWKTAAVNLSDMAASGAEPAWASLSLTLPQLDNTWLSEFSAGLFDLLSRYQVQLVGGDTSRGPLAVTLQIQGFVPAHKALYRSGAQPGDGIWLTGPLGSAGLALWCRQHNVDLSPLSFARLMSALDLPEPRIESGIKLRDVASSVIDVSDGLLADLGHICASSKMGAKIKSADVQRSPDFIACARWLQQQALITEAELVSLQLTAGDDYELCFTAAETCNADLDSTPAYHCIGVIEEGQGVRCYDSEGQLVSLQQYGFDHFLNKKNNETQ